MVNVQCWDSRWGICVYIYIYIYIYILKTYPILLFLLKENFNNV